MQLQNNIKYKQRYLKCGEFKEEEITTFLNIKQLLETKKKLKVLLNLVRLPQK